MELRGLKVNFLGDSITQGSCASRQENCYVEILSRSCALSAARNYGIGGTRIARQRVPSENPKYDLDFPGRVEEMDPDADLVLVFGGTNDHGHGDAPLGTDADRTADTFHGACHVLYQKLLARFPKARILVLTPLHRAEDRVPKADSGAILADYVEIIRKTAAQYGLPILDLFETSAIRADVPEIAARYTTDGLHPNDDGHALLAREIESYLSAL